MVLKRSIDIFLSICTLPFALVILSFAIIFLQIKSGGSVFFVQSRLGRDGIPFRIFKLRTMTEDPLRDVTRDILDSNSEILPFGRTLRRYKIDELPQILNVLLGDMSLVGPRPLPLEVLESIPEWAMCRFDVRPGMTGRVQVSGNVALSFDERCQHDVNYVKNMGYICDTKIMLKTILVVCLGESRFRVDPPNSSFS